MQKVLTHFTVGLYLCFGLIYSIGSTAEGLLRDMGVDAVRRGDTTGAEGYFRLASMANPLDHRPFLNLGKLKHREGSAAKDVRMLMEAKVYLKGTLARSGGNLKAELMLFDIDSQMGRPAPELFRRAKDLNSRYPNDLLVEKLAVETGIPLWERLDTADRELVLKLSHDLLLSRYWENLNIIELFIQVKNDFEILKKIIPPIPDLFQYHLPAIFKKFTTLKIDYEWYKNRFLEVQTAYDMENHNFELIKKGIYINQIKEELTKKSGTPGKFVDKKNIIGRGDFGVPIKDGEMYCNGTIYGMVTIEQDSKYIVITAKSTILNGISSLMVVSIDDKILGNVYVESEEYKEILFPLPEYSKGNYLIIISYKNNEENIYLKNHDRNLFIKSIEVR